MEEGEYLFPARVGFFQLQCIFDSGVPVLCHEGRVRAVLEEELRGVCAAVTTRQVQRSEPAGVVAGVILRVHVRAVFDEEADRING